MHVNFYHTLKVYYEDTDAGGVVYYANYLKYLERARTEALTTIGLSNLEIKEKFGSLIIVKSCNIEYKKPANLEDMLNINLSNSYVRVEVIADRDGFWLEPHCDIKEKLMSSIIFVNKYGEDENLGTDFYHPDLSIAKTIP